MTSNEIRSGFLGFFEERGHRIVPSAPVIPHGDPTLLFTNAGMNQFKDVFLGTGSREYRRAANTQKCIRVSGKHNDLEEVGRDTYHHTFFEMLGNWSFGDYYKEEAIRWAWELLTREWRLEKERLFATVFETDEEAEELWRRVTDIDPSHVLRFGKKDNFWEMGETGPCGPCSEIHIDMTPDKSGGSLVNAGDPRVMEIWNLVFIQNNRKESGELEDLPAKHVDTGMGFERICAVLQERSSNYDTDLFAPIIGAISQVAGTKYTGSLDSPSDIAMRVIADHVRMLTFSIADGAIPGNEGRGYVLRRILRRAARFGRTLGMHQPFIHAFAGNVVESLGAAFPEIREKQAHVERVIRAEEEGFSATLDRGLEIFESVVKRIGSGRVFPGEDAFRLYDTYGFPLDLTRLMAEERGLHVEADRFSELMQEQQARSRESGKEIPQILHFMSRDKDLAASEFRGYEELETSSTIVELAEGFVVLDRTPFYAEAGGQVGDTGLLFLAGGLAGVRVLDTKRDGKLIAHRVEEPIGDVGTEVRAKVDTQRRINIQRNHSATHLVHEALRRVLGTHVHQQGSLVAPDRLRFDFPHFGRITPDEIRAIEEMVNAKIREDIRVLTEVDLPLEQARKIPNVKMFFGDKYGDTVRVVFIDEQFSIEFCGGTHVRSTKEIGLLKIISEGSIASGTRRIEAVTGDGIIAYLNERIDEIRKADEQLARLHEELAQVETELYGAPAPGKKHSRPSLGEVAPPMATAEGIREIEARLSERYGVLQETGKRLADLRKETGKHRASRAASRIDSLVADAIPVNGFKLVSSRIAAEDLDQLKSLGDTLRSRLGSGVGVLASVIDEKATFVCVVTDDLIRDRNLLAGRIVGEMAKQVGGKGGGKPHLATAGGREIAKLDEALAGAADIVRAMLRNP
jgi:alanyl-tRNA synthetase